MLVSKLSRATLCGLVAFLASLSAALPAAAAEEAPRLLRQPALSADEIVFGFAGDLWSAPRAATRVDARRLTASDGLERDPVFSPDGATIAFTGEYDGNVDVFVMPAAGGPPVRLTFHPGDDRAVGWSRDGGRVLFRSDRDNGNGEERLWSVAAAGGWPERLPLPAAFWGSFSPDGDRLAYMPHQRFQLAWKRYRGGEATFVWVVDLETLEVEELPRERSNDSYPAWAEDGRIYFLSDRDGATTLFRFDPATRAVERVFDNNGLDLANAQAGPGAIVFERFGEIGLYDLASGVVRFPEITVASDLEGIRPRHVAVGDAVQGAAISPSGARAAFSARGEIVTVPAEKGDPHLLTRSPGAADREPAWSPDGSTIAWISDSSGDVALHLAAADGLSPARSLAPPSPTFLYQPVWSPDGRRIALHDVALRLWIVEVASGEWTHVDTDRYATPWRTFDPAWSPDSRFLAYTRLGAGLFHDVYVHDVAAKRSSRLTDGLADVRFPVFDASGKYLWMAASTDFGPSTPWLDMTGVERPVTRTVWLAVLAAAEPSPFPPESDEEKVVDTVADEGVAAAPEDAAGKAPTKADRDPAAGPPPTTVIDLDGIASRIVAVPGVEPRHYQSLVAGKAGVVFLHGAPPILEADADGVASGPLWRYEIETREAEKLADEVARVHASHDGEKLLVRIGKAWSIVAAGEAIEPGKGTLALDAVTVRVDPREEWRQIFREAWRLQRDFFYDPGYHGLDLAAAEARYAPYVEGLAHRDDLNYLLVEMLGNLTVGHLYVGGGDQPEPPKVKGGLLGVDWEVADGRYRIARVYSPETWNTGLEAPLAAPGVAARPGEYLIAVEGREVRPPDSVYAAFEGTAGRRVRIRLAAAADGTGGRDLVVVPVESERRLRYRAWVEDNRREVARLSDGRLGYVHLPNTAGAGYDAFNRYFFPQLDRDGLLVDDRYNGGGLIADYVVEVLGRQPMWAVAARAGDDMISPAGAHFGPKAMLINRHAGSGGDALPWMFRHLGLGPLVGTRTWGGLVGIWDYPELIDGGRVTAPRGGLYTVEGRWEVENLGVAPDYEVEITPRDFAAGRDPQLEKGVALLLDALETNPPPEFPPRPPFPDYQTTPWRSEASQ